MATGEHRVTILEPQVQKLQNQSHTDLTDLDRPSEPELHLPSPHKRWAWVQLSSEGQ